eukprot:2890445-Amphidinium_carterae.1
MGVHCLIYLSLRFVPCIGLFGSFASFIWLHLHSASTFSKRVDAQASGNARGRPRCLNCPAWEASSIAQCFHLAPLVLCLRPRGVGVAKCSTWRLSAGHRVCTWQLISPMLIQ